jgi:hypothetical protein
MTGYPFSDPYFGNIHTCPNALLLPTGPPYMSIHLRTITKHFDDPTSHITTDEVLSRDIFHLSCFPTNYPWLCMIDVYEDHGQGLQLISTHHFSGDLEGETGTRPYIEITKQEILDFLKYEFQEEKDRARMWYCRAEEP